MNITLLKSKIHRAVVTQSDLNYVGSVTIDARLMREAGIVEYEKVAIADIDNGNRFETYVITGEEDSGIICLNGAAARCVSAGDKVIIMAYADMTPEEALTFKPAVLFVDKHNKIIRKASYEHHGLLSEQ
jgi:aspartate 1-decarboxylase